MLTQKNSEYGHLLRSGVDPVTPACFYEHIEKPGKLTKFGGF